MKCQKCKKETQQPATKASYAITTQKDKNGKWIPKDSTPIYLCQQCTDKIIHDLIENDDITLGNTEPDEEEDSW